MGSVFLARTHPYSDEPTLRAWVRESQDRDAYEHGSSYSGGWNMCRGLRILPQRVFSTQSEAEEYVYEHAEKWGDLLAVPFMKKVTCPKEVLDKDGPITELKAALDALLAKQGGLNPGIIARTKAGKSSTKGCPHCESKIAVKHIRHVCCPVCNQDFLTTDTDRKALAALELSIAKCRVKIDDRKLAIFNKTFPGRHPEEKFWLVGGVCAS